MKDYLFAISSPFYLRKIISEKNKIFNNNMCNNVKKNTIMSYEN